ncbi:MAG: ankyrin repeat domain-containing protein [Verrucomicrobiota bacterium]
MKTKASSSALFKACESGDAAKVTAALKAGAEGNARTVNGYIRDVTPLMLAANAASADCVRLLLKAGADVAARTTSESGGAGDQTALHFALLAGKAEKPHLDVVKLLLEAGANPDAASNNGTTPLVEAVRIGSKPLVNSFLAAGAKSHLQAGAKLSPLHAAAAKGRTEIVELLLARGVPVGLRDAQGKTALMDAVSCGQITVMETLLEAKADPHAASADDRTVFIWAALFARDASDEDEAAIAVRLLERLVKLGVDVKAKDAEGSSAADYGAAAYEESVTKFFKQLGAKSGGKKKS